MDKFSKMHRKKADREEKEELLYSDGHIKIIKFEDWSVIKDKDLVVCIPYLIETNQFILRQEYIPTFKYVDGSDYHVTLIGGGVENGETPDVAMARELEEEAGIVLNEEYVLEGLKPIFMSKGITTKVYPYIIPLNEREFEEIVPPTDGSKLEKMARNVKIDAKYINSINSSDLITDYMLLRLKEYMNTQKY